MTRAACGVALVLLAGAVAASAGTRFALAWPPTRYASAELVLWLDDPARPATIRVAGRGIDELRELAGAGAVRIPLPAVSQCASGVDRCAIVAERVGGSGTFAVALQSPDTAGAPDTLLLTAHDTVLLPPVEAAAADSMILAAPSPATDAFPESASFAAIVPTAWPARVTTTAGCAPASDAALADGEVLTLACRGRGADVTGIEVHSDVTAIVVSGNVVTQVPWDGAPGASGDLVMDLSPPPAQGPTTLVAPPLPRLRAGTDPVRVLALAETTVLVGDGLTAPASRRLAAGESWDVDLAASGRALRIDADGPVAAWQLLQSRVLRGQGDPAAMPLVPRAAFVRQARFFAPDGYAEANAVAIVAETGASVRLDGTPVSGWQAAPGGDLAWTVVALPPPPATTGAVHDLVGDAPFGAWVVGLGGYKAHGMAAAIAWPPPASGVAVLRGTRPDALAVVAHSTDRSYRDPATEPLVYWSIGDDLAALTVARCAFESCLAW